MVGSRCKCSWVMLEAAAFLTGGGSLGKSWTTHRSARAAIAASVTWRRNTSASRMEVPRYLCTRSMLANTGPMGGAAFFDAAPRPWSGYGQPVKRTMGDAEPLIGRILAEKYLLRSRLGEGGFGSIWRAEHLVLKSPVAVKLIDLEIARKDGAVERFLREAQATAALRSPHVVQVLDYGVEGEQPFIVMELLEGENLAERLEREKRLAPLEVARIVTHVARAMSKAHELGIVHRDLKPENIFIVNTGDEELAKVLDFGVAKFATTPELNRDTYTKTGALIGTPYYMSPEQAQGNKAVDSRSDLWALGVISFEMMTGQRPFDGDALGDLVLTICVRSISVPSAIAPVPEGFDAWFAKAVERDPAARFQTAREMALALLSIVGSDAADGISLGLDDRSNLPPPALASDAGVEIPSRPNSAAFAATVRDNGPALLPDSRSTNPLPNVSPSPTGHGNAGVLGLHNPGTPLPLLYEDPVDDDEHLPPWAVVGIALLALAAGAAVVYGLFFLLRAHDASNDPLDESASDPSANVSADPRNSRARFDVIATGKPNHPEANPGRATKSPSVPNAAAVGASASARKNEGSAPTSVPQAASSTNPVASTSAPATAVPPSVPPADLTPPTPPAPVPAPIPMITAEVPAPMGAPNLDPLPSLSGEAQHTDAPVPAPPFEEPAEPQIDRAH